MDLLKAYHGANSILNTLDFNALFPGFHKYRFALYNSKEICLDGKLMSYQHDFRGNTSILYEGAYIAIWNAEFDPIADPQILAYSLVHEMFHCHQLSNRESRFPSDFALLHYPDDTDNFLKKYNENRYLANAYKQCDMVQLRRFAWIRDKRKRAYPDMVLQELRAETIEGMAEYVGLKALKIISEEKFEAIVSEYIDRLRAEGDSFFDVRRMSYFSGAVFFLCLDKLGLSVHNDFNRDITAYEQNPIDIDGVTAEIHPYEFISMNYAKLTEEKEAKVAAHMAYSHYVQSHAFICGYDPMNMFRVGNLIYCSHFVCLDEEGVINSINSAVVLKLADGSDQEVVGYYIA